MWANRTYIDEAKTQWGWYSYYDIETGKPIAMQRREVRFLEPPEGAADRGYTGFLKSIEKQLVEKVQGHAARVAARRTRVEWLQEQERRALAGAEPYRFPLLRLFDWDVGSWLFWSRETPVGPAVVPQTVRVALAIDDLFSMRLAKGQVPWSHPYVGFRAVDWGRLSSRVVPPEVLTERIPPTVLREARGGLRSSE